MFVCAAGMSYVAGMRNDADQTPRKKLTPEAERALAEAAARRAEADKQAHEPRPVEHQGPKGPEPTRFGDWERKGIASDF